MAGFLGAILDAAADAAIYHRPPPVIVTDAVTGRHLAKALAAEIGCHLREISSPGCAAMVDGVRIRSKPVVRVKMGRRVVRCIGLCTEGFHEHESIDLDELMFGGLELRV